ncbi:hypothetical protein CHARACLAT_011094 [Characodon lateralis]|uniref:Uncharacterized protein n=1 Tax=Characodon lateralis TaxID=208331 RepID=A0ABU7DTU6_9TELE|nr:hypothetical protein [Characodon lateralis]
MQNKLLIQTMEGCFVSMEKVQNVNNRSGLGNVLNAKAIMKVFVPLKYFLLIVFCFSFLFFKCVLGPGIAVKYVIPGNVQLSHHIGNKVHKPKETKPRQWC